MRDPLISVIVTNFNYGRFLDRCLKSIVMQTYKNYEIILCDNASSDQSMAVARKYIESFSARITVLRHRVNIGSAANYLSGENVMRGDYFINMGADDYLACEKYFELVINLFKKYPGVSQIISHADSVDDADVVSQRVSFFNGSYLMPGLSYAPILMVAGVTSHTSQTVFSTAAHFRIGRAYDFISSPTLGERTLAMMHAAEYDVIYLSKAFIVCRDSATNETHRLNADVSQIIEQWSVIRQFSEFAERRSLHTISARKDQSELKMADLCMRYCADFLRLKNYKTAGRYLALGLLLRGDFDQVFRDPDHIINEIFLPQIKSAVSQSIVSSREKQTLRQHSYAPPDGSHAIDI